MNNAVDLDAIEPLDQPDNDPLDQPDIIDPFLKLKNVMWRK